MPIGLPSRLIVLATICWAAPAEEPPPAPFEIKLRRENDTATIQREPGRTLVCLNSPGGIGAATLTRTDPAIAWPEHLEVELPLRGLEGLTLHAGKRILIGSMSHDTPPVQRFAERLPDGKEMPIDQSSPLWPTLTVSTNEPPEKPATEEAMPLRRFRFQLTPALLNAAGNTLTVKWVDFYRN